MTIESDVLHLILDQLIKAQGETNRRLDQLAELLEEQITLLRAAAGPGRR